MKPFSSLDNFLGFAFGGFSIIFRNSVALDGDLTNFSSNRGRFPMRKFKTWHFWGKIIGSVYFKKPNMVTRAEYVGMPNEAWYTVSASIQPPGLYFSIWNFDTRLLHKNCVLAWIQMGWGSIQECGCIEADTVFSSLIKTYQLFVVTFLLYYLEMTHL